jgi:ActR/RegA family two-component response regulator
MPDVRRILVVEDDEYLLYSFSRAITRAGYEVQRANSVETALDKIDCWHFHAALLDIMLTDNHRDRSGVDLIREFQSINEGTRCIAISAHPAADIMVEAIRAGVHDWISKRDIHRPQDYLSVVCRHANESNLTPFGHHRDIFSYLEQSLFQEEWKTVVTTSIHVNAVYLRLAIYEMIVPFLPILPPVRLSENMNLSKEHGAVSFSFWSKARGGAYQMSLGNRPIGHIAQDLTAKKSYPTFDVVVVSCPLEPRSNFVRRAIDVPVELGSRGRSSRTHPRLAGQVEHQRPHGKR